MKIDVLGTAYTVDVIDADQDEMLNGKRDGYTDTSIKACVIDSMNDESPEKKKNIIEYRKSVIRHELIHAFLFESGLDATSWATNEEMVDWIALQFPKMMKAFQDVDCL